MIIFSEICNPKEKTRNGQNVLSPELHEYLYPKHSSEDEIVKETLTFHKSTNRLIQKEIDALRSHVQEAEQDMATLKEHNIQAVPDSISGQKTLEDTSYGECAFGLFFECVLFHVYGPSYQ